MIFSIYENKKSSNRTAEKRMIKNVQSIISDFVNFLNDVI